MSYGAALASIVVYCVIAGISSSARYTRAAHLGQVTVYPVLRSTRFLIWIGGLFCLGFGTYCIFSDFQIVLSVGLVALGTLTPFIPLRPIMVSPSGVEQQQALWWKKRTFHWNEIDRVEVWKAARMIVLVHGKRSIAHTRYHIDEDEFLREVKVHILSDRWVMKGLRA
jgi:hypothetical protein